MNLSEMQELLNNLGAYFRVYVDRKDQKRAARSSNLILEVFHSDDNDTTQIAFDMDGLNGILMPASQKNS